jgi:hypothetical protein
MNLQTVVSEICDQADEFLAGVTKRDQARAGIAEWLTIHYAALSPVEKKDAADQAMRILGQEGFFERPAGGSE